MKYIKYIFLVPLIIFIVTIIVVHVLSSVNTSYSSSTVMSTCTTKSEVRTETTNCSYKSFKGTKVLRKFVLQENQEINIDYEIGIISGAVKLSIVDKNKNVKWEETLNTDNKGIINFKALEKGDFQLIFYSEGTKGNYIIKYDKNI